MTDVASMLLNQASPHEAPEMRAADPDTQVTLTLEKWFMKAKKDNTGAYLRAMFSVAGPDFPVPPVFHFVGTVNNDPRTLSDIKKLLVAIGIDEAQWEEIKSELAASFTEDPSKGGTSQIGQGLECEAILGTDENQRGEIENTVKQFL